MKLQQMNPSLFDWLHWRINDTFFNEFGFQCRYASLTSAHGKEVIRKYAVGWANGESLICRPKVGHKGVMFFKNDRHFWVHLRNKEFEEIFGE